VHFFFIDENNLQQSEKIIVDFFHLLSLSRDQNRGDQPLSVEEAGSEKKKLCFFLPA
jgi:hypothetical protein